MKIYTVIVWILLSGSQVIFSQATEIECVVKGRMGVYLVLEPAHYDETLLPAAGSKLLLSLYVKEGLPEGKEPGYYEVGEIEYIEPMTDMKRLRFKLLADVEAARLKHGIKELYLKMGEKVKISWEK